MSNLQSKQSKSRSKTIKNKNQIPKKQTNKKHNPNLLKNLSSKMLNKVDKSTNKQQ